MLKAILRYFGKSRHCGFEGSIGIATSKVIVHFSCPVERVWQIVTDLSRTAWRSDLTRVELLDETHFVEHTKSGYATNFTVTACESLRRWSFTMENGNMSGSWEGIFETAEGGDPLHRNRQRQALVDAPLCPRLFEAAAEAVSERFAEGTAEMSRVNLHCLRQRAILPTM